MFEVERPLCFIRLTEATHRVSQDKTAVYNTVRRGEFPNPVPMGSMVAWVESEMKTGCGHAWLSARLRGIRRPTFPAHHLNPQCGPFRLPRLR